MPTPPYSPSRIEISIPDRSSDGLYWGRYPNGNKPGGLQAGAVALTSATGDMKVKKPLVGGIALALAVAGILSGGSLQRIKWIDLLDLFGSGGTWENGDNIATKFFAEMDQALGTNVTIGGVPQAPNWIHGYKQFVGWASLDNGPVTFTGSIGGLTSGTLTAAPHNLNQVYFARFTISGVAVYRNVTVTGTAATWAGTGQFLGALPAGTVTTADFYMFSGIDLMLNRLATHYAVPKLYVPHITAMSFSTAPLNPNDDSRIPFYISNNAIYGPSPPGTSGTGWWGANNQGGTCSAAVWRPLVATRYGLLWQALGVCYDSNPLFYAVVEQETSAYAGDASARNSFTYAGWALGQAISKGTIRQSGSNNYMCITAISSTTTAPTGTGANIVDGSGAWKWLNVLNQNDGTYSDAGLLSACQTYLSLGKTSLKTTNMAVANTFFVGPTACQQLTKWMCDNAIAQSTDDSSGQNYYDAGNSYNSWGMAAYFGMTVAGSTWTPQPDQRGLSAYFADIEQPDISATLPLPLPHVQPAIPSTLPAIRTALNNVVHAQMAWNCIISKSGTPNWAAMSAIIQGQPLTTSGYPPRYPQ